MEHSTVHSLLRDVVESPAPLSAVDIQRAVRAGRRRVRLRRLLSGVGSVAAVVTVVGVTVSLLPGTSSGPGPASPGSTSAAPSPGVAMPQQAPEQFHPTAQYAGFGWLPDGMIGSSITVALTWLTVSAEYQGLPTNGDDPVPASIDLVIASAGYGVDTLSYSDLAIDAGQMQPGTETEPVNGRRAVWESADYGATVLRWEYAPGAWAAIRVSLNLPGIDGREAARQIAENIVYGLDVPIRLPFETTGIPASFPVAQVSVGQHDGGFSAQVSYGKQRTAYGDLPLSIIVTPMPEQNDGGGVLADPDTTLDGYPARFSTPIEGGEALQVFEVDGLYVELMAHGDQTAAALPDGLAGLFRATEFYPDPADWR